MLITRLFALRFILQCVWQSVLCVPEGEHWQSQLPALSGHWTFPWAQPIGGTDGRVEVGAKGEARALVPITLLLAVAVAVTV